jgi:CubicO group peptidase (beta-lactamase class C family)
LPGEQFADNNSAFVMLSLVVEATTGSFHQAVRDRVFAKAAMPDAGFSAQTTFQPTLRWATWRTDAATFSSCLSSVWAMEASS